MFRGLLGRQVIINGRDGIDWQGRLVEVRREYVRLEDYAIGLGGAPQPAAGVARIPLTAVAWVGEL